MRKRIFILTILFAILFLSIFATQDNEKKDIETKGIIVRVKDQKDKDVIVYKNSYALLIGVWDYDHWRSFEKENFENEIENLVQCLRQQKFIVRKVLNPTSQKMEKEIEDFKDKYGFNKENRLLFFFSGHGHSRAKRTKGYLVPKDAPLPEESVEKERDFLRKAIDFVDIKSLAEKTEVKHFLFVFDCCFSGAIFETKSSPKVPPDIKDYMANTARQFITAGKADEKVPEKSVFIPAFVRGLRDCKADRFDDGYITAVELYKYIKKEVMKSRINQTPQYGSIKTERWSEAGDFVFINPCGSVIVGEVPCLPEKREEWSKELDKLKNDIAKMKTVDGDKNISPELKIDKWEELWQKYKDDNPCFREDESLKDEIKGRIWHWEGVIFKRSLKQARLHYRDKKYKDARYCIGIAKRIKISPELLKLEKKIDKKIRKIEKVKKRKDDSAFRIARKTNTIKSYKTYIDEHPSGIHLVEAFHNSGVIYWKEGKWDKAISHFSIAIDLNPGDAESYNNRGVCYRYKGKYEESIKDYNKALELYKRHEKAFKEKETDKINRKLAVVYNNRGVSYKETGGEENKKLALIDYNMAITLNENYGDAYFNRGLYFLELGDHENAEDAFRKAIKCNKKDAEAHEKLALVSEKGETIKEAEKVKK